MFGRTRKIACQKGYPELRLFFTKAWNFEPSTRTG